MMQSNALLISLEGFECSGKSSAIKYISKMLEDDGIEYVVSREPGGTHVGQTIRELLYAEADNMHPSVEAMLFYADRVQHNKDVIRPALEQGKVVITDRYYDSTLAYQGALGSDFAYKYHEFLMSCDLITPPDYTIFFDIGLDVYKKRKRARGDVAGEEVNTFEDSRDDSYHSKVIANFRIMAKQNPDRCVTVNAEHKYETVKAMVEHIIQTLVVSQHIRSA